MDFFSPSSICDFLKCVFKMWIISLFYYVTFNETECSFIFVLMRYSKVLLYRRK